MQSPRITTIKLRFYLSLPNLYWASSQDVAVVLCVIGQITSSVTRLTATSSMRSGDSTAVGSGIAQCGVTGRSRPGECELHVKVSESILCCCSCLG